MSLPVPSASATVATNDVDVVIPSAARAVRRGRHRAGRARARGPAVRRRGRARFRGRDGQDRDEAHVRRRPDCETAPSLALRDGHDVDDFVATGRGRARVPVLREAREHGFLGRREQGAQRARSYATRSRTRSRSTSGSSPRRWCAAARSRSGSSATTRRSRRCRARSYPPPTSTTTPTSTRTARPSCARPRRSPPTQIAEVQRLAVRAFEACRGEAMARVDFFLRDDGVFVVNEVNTIPGLHADLDVPAALGGLRRSLRRAPRPPHRPRHRPRRPPRRRRGRQR